MVAGAAQKAPKYLRETGWQCPTDPHDGLMQYAFQTKLSTFEFFSTMPGVFADFNMFMGNTMGARSYWVDWFPVQERLLDGAMADSALIVDVGGGRGHDLQAFHEKHPRQGRLVLQDLTPVVGKTRDPNPAIESMSYDFFTPQPVEGEVPLYPRCGPFTRPYEPPLIFPQERVHISFIISSMIGPTLSVWKSLRDLEDL